MLSVGFTDDEIYRISEREYNKIMDMKITNIQKEEHYVKTINFENIDGSISSYDEYISKSQAYNEISNFDQSNSGIETARISPDIMIEDGVDLGGGGTSEDQTHYSSETTEYKYLTVTGTFYKNKGNLWTFFIKVNLEWLKTPLKRLTDIISINFTDNVQITYKYFGVNQFPDFNFKFTYDEKYTSIYRFNTELDETYETYAKSIIYDGSNTSRYIYKPGEGLAVDFDLPINHSQTITHTLGETYTGYNYENFFVSLSADFVPNQSGNNAATFAGAYNHQISTGTLNKGCLSLSPVPPYISYNIDINNFFENKPNYDETIARQIFFDSLA